MSSRWRLLASLPLLAFALIVLFWQACHFRLNNVNLYYRSSPGSMYILGRDLAAITNIVDRDSSLAFPETGPARYLDLTLPADARVFMTGMIGPTNFWKIGRYFRMTYYLFPREIGVSLDQPARQTKDGFLGRTTDSSEEMLINRFDVRMDINADETLKTDALHKLEMQKPITPDWFNGNFDTIVAFLLPLFTAFSGVWLLRFCFGSLVAKMSPLEQLACGFGLGMMAVAALTLGLKLCGIHGHGFVFAISAIGALAEIGRDRKSYLNGVVEWCLKVVRHPVQLCLTIVGLIIFLLLFRLAGLMGLVESDAIMGWALKAKLIHLYVGKDLVQWFSAPRLAHAHLDYPTLVPSLHSATYDSLGHANEFVTKFWPTWMLLLLLAFIGSLARGRKVRFYSLHFVLLYFLLLPVTVDYVQAEGATMPMVFFTVLGCVQCVRWLAEGDRMRLGLGFTLLFGAAITKYEGAIFLVLVAIWILLSPSCRRALGLWPHFGRAIGFCALAVLPYLCLRAQIQVVNYETNWIGYAVQNVGSTLANWPVIFLMLLARLFVNKDFADWIEDDGKVRWIGHWDGVSSLYDPSSYGLAWLCLVVSVVLWFAIPSRRPILVWIVAMVIGVTAQLSGISASFSKNISAEHLIDAAKSSQQYYIPLLEASHRYFFPILTAWFATVLALFILDDSALPAADQDRS